VDKIAGWLNNRARSPGHDPIAARHHDFAAAPRAFGGE
jgi:hypothetical protein